MGSHPDLFDNLDDKTTAAVIALAHRTRRRPGEWFFNEGERAREFFLLTNGVVKLTRLTAGGHEITLRLLGRGAPFGAIDGLGPPTYGVNAIAVAPSEALTWTSHTMREVLKTNGVLTLNALELMVGRLQELQQRYCQSVSESVERRVARALLRLVKVGGHRGERGIEVEFPVSRQDVADMAGTTLFTVSRLLRGWERQGILRGQRRRHISLVNLRALVAIAHGTKHA